MVEAPEVNFPAPQGPRNHERLAALDALRGLASLSVFSFHIYVFSAFSSTLRLPSGLDWLLRHGSFGVDVFFVLSGVAIGLSVAGKKITSRFATEFGLRRMLRLSPPYWVALTAAAAIYAAMHKAPTAGSFFAHFLYLQNLLGYNNIVSQFWTLGYEVQFYAVLILLIAIGQRFGKGAAWAAAILPLAVSLAMVGTGTGAHGWFIDRWYEFAAGAATAGVVVRRIRSEIWIGLMGSLLVFGIGTGNLGVMVLACMVVAVGIAGLRGKLSCWTGGPVLRWLGKISYSLYLTHFLSSALAKRWAPQNESQAGAILAFGAVIGSGFAVAEVFYRVVEQPSHRLSRRVRVTR